MVAKLLIGWGSLVLGGLVLLFVAAAFANAWIDGGWRSVSVLAVFFSAFPALFVGLWLKHR